MAQRKPTKNWSGRKPGFDELKTILADHKDWLEQFEQSAPLQRDEWREKNPPPHDLSGADLKRAELSGKDLRWVKFIKAMLNAAVFAGANLNGADLTDASLAGAIFTGADLRDAHLNGAKLTETDLKEAELKGADLSGAKLCGTKLGEVDLSGVKFIDARFIAVDLSGAELNGAKLNGANLKGTELRGAKLSGADLCGADLSGARLLKANLAGANLSGAKLNWADLSGANLGGTDLSNCDVTGVRYHRPLCCFILPDLHKARLQKLVHPLWARFQKFVRPLRAKLQKLEYPYKARLQKLAKNQRAWLREFFQQRLVVRDPGSLTCRGVRAESCYGSPRFRRDVMDQDYLEEMRSTPMGNIIYRLWDFSSNCGRSFTLWALLSALFALVFASVFWLLGPESFKVPGGELYFSQFTMLYYSVVTFTTLGFGDITPLTRAASFWVMFEVVAGYIMLGGLISIFANKMVPRGG